MLAHQAELFSELSESEREELLSIAQEKQFSKNNILFFEGDEPNVLFYLLSGIIKVYKVDSKGSEIVLHQIQAPSLVAELANLQKIPFPASARCETDCQVLTIDYGKFEKRFLRNPNVSIKVITSLCKKIMFLEQAITKNMTMDAQSRLCKFLFDNEELLPTLTQRKIASILNIAPETLSRNLANLKKEGVVRIEKRTIVVEDKKRLLSYIQV